MPRLRGSGLEPVTKSQKVQFYETVREENLSYLTNNISDHYAYLSLKAVIRALQKILSQDGSELLLCEIGIEGVF